MAALEHITKICCCANVQRSTVAEQRDRRVKGSSTLQCKQKCSFLLLVGRTLLIPSWQRTWSGSESPERQTAEVTGGWEHIEEFMLILRGEKKTTKDLEKASC